MIERVHVRLCVWAEEVAGGVGMTEAGGFLGKVIDNAGMACGGSRGSRVLISSLSDEVESAVNALPSDMREAVKVYYFEGGFAVAVRAKKLKISARTLNRRISGAHVLLDANLHGFAVPRVV